MILNPRRSRHINFFISSSSINIVLWYPETQVADRLVFITENIESQRNKSHLSTSPELDRHKRGAPGG
jgi:hypothetical protein